MESLLALIVNGAGWAVAGWFFKRELDHLRKEIHGLSMMQSDIHKLETSLKVLQTEAVKRNGYDEKLALLRKDRDEKDEKMLKKIASLARAVNQLKNTSKHT